MGAAKDKEQSGASKHLVVTEFRDINDFNLIHEVGKDVSDFDSERLKKLIELELVS